jgi:membrane protein
VVESYTRIRARADELQAWAEKTIFWRIWERMLENEFIDRSVALGAKAFVSFFPAIIVIAAFMPDNVRNSIYETLLHRAGLSGPGLATVKSAFATSDDVRKATGIVGLLFTFFYISSFTTALQRVYARAWRRPRSGRVSGYALGSAWLIGVVAYFALLGGARAVLAHGPESVAFGIVAVAASVYVWTLTPWVMLQREVRFRVLIPTGIITGLISIGYALSASLWMPRTVTENQRQFGFFGVALALVTWLTGTAVIVVIGACAGPVLAEDEGRVGQLVRGSHAAPVLAPGARPSLAAPADSPTLLQALGRRRGGDAAADDDDPVPEAE